MRTLARFEVKLGESRVSMPVESEIICATGYQEGVSIWVEVDDKDKDFVDRAFLTIKEGEEIGEKMILNYIGHAFIPSGDVVVVFEIL